MRDFFYDLRKSIKVRGHWYFILIFLLIFSSFLFSTAVMVMGRQAEIKRRYEKTYMELQYYSLYDSLTGEEAENFYQNPPSVLGLKKLNGLLQQEESFTYLEIYDNMVYIKDYTGPLKNLGGYEENNYANHNNVEIHGKGTGFYSGVKGMWLGKNVAEHFELPLSEGKFPEERDFIWSETDTIKVVLGSGYRDVYQLGDRFGFDCFIANREAEVVGFLEEGAALPYNYRGLINLDNYLLLPQYDMEQLSKEVDSEAYHSFWFIYLMKNNGMIASYTSAEYVQETVYSLCEKAGLSPIYYVSGANNQQLGTFGKNMGELTKTLLVLAISGMILSVALLCVHFVLRIKDNTQYYAILCCCGSSFGKIIGLAAGELFGLLLLSVTAGYLLAVFLASLIMEPLPGAYLPFLFTAAYGMLPFLVSLHRLRRLEIAKALRGE